MKPIALPLFLVVVLAPAGAAAQVENMGPKAATYITDADVKKVNALPGVDRQIVSVDIGKLNTAVGIVHRGTTRKPPTPPPTGANASTPAPNAPPAPVPCGEQMASLPAVVAGTGISHDHQTETYIIISGCGTLITGGRVLNGRKSAPRQPGDHRAERPVVQRHHRRRRRREAAWSTSATSSSSPPACRTAGATFPIMWTT